MYDCSDADEHDTGVEHRMAAEMYEALVVKRPKYAKGLAAEDEDDAQEDESLPHARRSIHAPDDGGLTSPHSQLRLHAFVSHG
jgi:hypothetical protein